MPPPGLRIYLRLHVTLTFELVTPKLFGGHNLKGRGHIFKLVVSSHCPVDHDHLCRLASKSIHSLSKYHVHKFGNGRTDGHVDNIMPPPESLTRQRHKISKTDNDDDDDD